MNQAFDAIAEGYDLSFTFTEIGKLQREVVRKYLQSSILGKKKLNILELNSGTGVDAIWLAKDGHRVLATDISGKMLEIINQKVESEKLNSQIQTMNVDITQFKDYHFNERYDFVFSNFGGLNCIGQEDMRKLPEVISHLLELNGRIILVVMSKYCIWETIYFLMKFNFKNAFRRYSDVGATAQLNGSDLRTYYYTPKKVKDMFKTYFDVIAIKPVGFAIPPSYLEKFFTTKKSTLNFLERVERLFADTTLAAKFSDHFLIDLQVKR